MVAGTLGVLRRLVRRAIALSRCLARPRAWTQASSPEPDPAAIRERRYRAALDGLPAATRAIFLLHRVEGLAIASIAQRHELSSAQVERHLADAILALWTALGDGLD